MNFEIIQENGISIAWAKSSEILVTDVQSSLDLIATIAYETGCHHIILDKAALAEDFFDLSTRIAGEILQKFVNYDTKLAIVGDFSVYSSKALRDFIYESNRGRHIFFVPSQDEAIKKLSQLV